MTVLIVGPSGGATSVTPDLVCTWSVHVLYDVSLQGFRWNSSDAAIAYTFYVDSVQVATGTTALGNTVVTFAPLSAWPAGTDHELKIVHGSLPTNTRVGAPTVFPGWAPITPGPVLENVQGWPLFAFYTVNTLQSATGAPLPDEFYPVIAPLAAPTTGRIYPRLA